MATFFVCDDENSDDLMLAFSQIQKGDTIVLHGHLFNLGNIQQFINENHPGVQIRITTTLAQDAAYDLTRNATTEMLANLSVWLGVGLFDRPTPSHWYFEKANKLNYEGLKTRAIELLDQLATAIEAYNEFPPGTVSRNY